MSHGPGRRNTRHESYGVSADFGGAKKNKRLTRPSSFLLPRDPHLPSHEETCRSRLKTGSSLEPEVPNQCEGLRTIIEGASLRAKSKSACTSLFDSPYHLFVSTENGMLIKVALDSLARALASNVLPHPKRDVNCNTQCLGYRLAWWSV